MENCREQESSCRLVGPWGRRIGGLEPYGHSTLDLEWKSKPPFYNDVSAFRKCQINHPREGGEKKVQIFTLSFVYLHKRKYTWEEGVLLTFSW